MNPGEVIRWWEGRRFFFNSVVGCTGVITCVVLIACAFTADSTVGEPIGMPDGPLLGVFGIVFYGILANVFYTGGWISELLLRALTTTEKASALGLRASRAGVYFSGFSGTSMIGNSQGEAEIPLDCYLSWTSPKRPESRSTPIGVAALLQNGNLVKFKVFTIRSPATYRNPDFADGCAWIDTISRGINEESKSIQNLRFNSDGEKSGSVF